MKILGTTGDSWNTTYICTVEHRELEKFLGLYYSRDAKLGPLKAGEEVDLGKGHDYAADIAKAMQATQDLIKAHQPVVSAILNGLRIQAVATTEPKAE